MTELADLVCSASARHKVLAMLRGYFDDTGTHKGSPVVGVGGFIGDVSAWTAVEAEWIAKLRDYGASNFHAYDCANGLGEFVGMKHATRSNLVMELANILSRHDLIPIAAAVDGAAWEHLRQMDRAKDQAFFVRYPRPFVLCFDHCIQVASNWSRDFKGGESIAMVFNEQASDADDAREIFDAYKISKRYGAMLESLTFAAARGRPPLQCVDLLANETFRYWIDLTKSPSTPLRDAIRIMWNGLDFNLARFYGGAGLLGAIRNFVP